MQTICYPVNVNVNPNTIVAIYNKKSPVRNLSNKPHLKATHISQALCKHRNAILGPTPVRDQSSSTVFGTSLLKSSLSLKAACLMYPVFLLQNPSFEIASEMILSGASMSALSVILPPRATLSFATAASVTSSFV